MINFLSDFIVNFEHVFALRVFLTFISFGCYVPTIHFTTRKNLSIESLYQNVIVNINLK